MNTSGLPASSGFLRARFRVAQRSWSVERRTLLGGHLVHVGDGVAQAAECGSLRFQFRFGQRSFQIRQQPLRSLQCLANRLGRIGRALPTPLLSRPIRLDLTGQGILAAETRGCGVQVAAEKT